MSESRQAAGPGVGRNRAQWLDFTLTVRFLHRLAAVLLDGASSPVQLARFGAPARALALSLPAAACVACVVPPELSPEADDTPAGNSPPIIVSVTDGSGNPFTRPGPRTITIGDDVLSVTVSDNDLDDALTLYFFVDYGLPTPTPRRVECPAVATDTPLRTVRCVVNTVCLEGEQQRNPHVLEIEVFDRPPVDNGDPPFRSVAAPGMSSGWWWQINCAESGS